MVVVEVRVVVVVVSHVTQDGTCSEFEIIL